MTWRHRGRAAVVGVALAAASCGGDGGVEADSWLGDVDARCTQARAELDASDPVTGAGNPAVPVRARAEVVRSQADDVEALGKPAEHRREAETFVNALEDQARALDRLADSLLSDPTAAAGPLGASVTVANERVSRAASELGLSSCAVFATGVAGDADAPDSPDAPAIDEDAPAGGEEGGPGGFVEEG